MDTRFVVVRAKMCGWGCCSYRVRDKQVNVSHNFAARQRYGRFVARPREKMLSSGIVLQNMRQVVEEGQSFSDVGYSGACALSSSLFLFFPFPFLSLNK